MASQNSDESFQLYDLRVEVVCPPGRRIMCGAKDGDYFMLQGEMLYLPPNQGFSIYSLELLQETIGSRPRLWLLVQMHTALHSFELYDKASGRLAILRRR
ncbi:hypothetical protein CMQ_3371 [Grosmannia clavigera kw1407]|uniref:Uncharacterized protein n=1 Tax=Grosmannia clavigera (strain kw1407 / UAMH 11150) TaxID=655863 RepID=F0X9Q6_GROCL|nr:uncharacterized protein CMQ_3371 [Grosmannia clavigera kw1407]EFX05302.1 hypothetical protein CMQ_3371 [Grosmannia clavigera kw1407]